MWVTTRDPLPGEADGVNYTYVEDFAFQVCVYGRGGESGDCMPMVARRKERGRVMPASLTKA